MLQRYFVLAFVLCCFPLSAEMLLAQAHPDEVGDPQGVVAGLQPANTPAADTNDRTRPVRDAAYGRLPLAFEPNRGQMNDNARFLARGRGFTLLLAATESLIVLGTRRGIPTDGRRRDGRFDAARGPKTASLLVKLIGANPSAQMSGLDELPGKSHYFVGSNPANWHTNVPTYARVKYNGIYPGVDLIYYGNQEQLEYDFVLSPGADPDVIMFAVEGAGEPELDRSGNLVLNAAGGRVLLQKPQVYQEISGARREVAGAYVLEIPHQVRFAIGSYDPEWPLVIDPILGYSSYLGGSSADYGLGVAVDSTGNAYVTGYTASGNFPISGPFQPSYNGSYDAFVSKINPAGNALVYSSYLGGGGWDSGSGIAVDAAGNAYVAGRTESSNFPTLNPFQPVFNGEADAFVLKLGPTGGVLAYSTYLGGALWDGGYAIALDAAGSAYVSGITTSTNFPTANPQQATYGGGNGDAFVTKFAPSGSSVVYSTFLGSGGSDGAFGIALSSTGHAYVTGFTDSTSFPTKSAMQPAFGGGVYDAFAASLVPAGDALLFSTYLGGSDRDEGFGIRVDSQGAAYVAGHTWSTNFPTANPLQMTFGGGQHDAFVSKFRPGGATLAYSTYLGGVGPDGAYGIALDSAGRATVTGYSGSHNFPLENAFQPAIAGDWDAFATRLNPSGHTLAWSTYLGGSGSDGGYAVAVDSLGMVYLTGHTWSANFPTVGAIQTTFGGGNDDAFVAKIDPAPPVLAIALSKASYINGETVSVPEFRLKNLGAEAQVVELKCWLVIAGDAQIQLLNIGMDSSFVLPAAFNTNLGPLDLFPVTSALPRGNYELNSRSVNPMTGATLGESINTFLIQ